jgi:hypothetical protein
MTNRLVEVLQDRLTNLKFHLPLFADFQGAAHLVSNSGALKAQWDQRTFDWDILNQVVLQVVEPEPNSVTFRNQLAPGLNILSFVEFQAVEAEPNSVTFGHQ